MAPYPFISNARYPVARLEVGGPRADVQHAAGVGIPEYSQFPGWIGLIPLVAQSASAPNSVPGLTSEACT